MVTGPTTPLIGINYVGDINILLGDVPTFAQWKGHSS